QIVTVAPGRAAREREGATRTRYPSPAAPRRGPESVRMTNVLANIIQTKKEEVAAARGRVPLDDLKERAKATDPPRNFFAAVTRPPREVRIIAEVKKASPSAGVIRPDFDPVAIAKAYHANGAAAISCLTDETYFQGKLEYIAQIKAAVPLPVLR